MPEENTENQIAETGIDSTPATNLDSEKRRIKPVIEEIVPSSPADEAAPADIPAEEPKEEIHPEVHMSSQHPPMPEEPRRDLKLFVLVSVITALVVAALAGGIYVYVTGTQKSGGTAVETPLPTMSPEETPSPTSEATPSPTPKLSTYKIQILNGSGKIGEANAAKGIIEKEGFKVAATGNAATFDFEDTVIQAKSNVSTEVVDMLKEALSSKYSVVIGDKLSSSSSYDITITIGSK